MEFLLAVLLFCPGHSVAQDVGPRELLAQCERAAADGQRARAHELLTRSWDAAQAMAIDAGALSFLRSLAIAAARLGDLDTALAARRRILSEVEASRPAGDRELQRVRDELAMVLRERGDYAAARDLQEQALAALQEIAGPDDRDLLVLELNLAGTYLAIGDLERARALQESALAILERTTGENDRTLIAARINLAATLEALGHLPEAREMLERAHDAWSRTLPEDHADLASLRLNLAAVLQRMGELEEARELYEIALFARERTLPADHPEIQSARHNLAVLLRTLGERSEARQLLEQALAVYATKLPEDHPTLQVVQSSLALTLDDLGERDAARALFEQVLEARLRAQSEGHPDVAVARMNLATNLWRGGDLRRAKLQFEQALASLERGGPQARDPMLSAESNLAAVLLAMGDLPGARAMQEKVLSAREAASPADHPDVLVARANLGATHLELEEWSAARALFEGVVAARERSFGAGDPRTVAAAGNLAVALAETGELGRAREMLERIHAAGEDRDFGAIALDLARVLHRSGDSRAALALEEEVVAQRERALERGDPRLSSARSNLCRTLASLGEWDALAPQVAALERDLWAVTSSAELIAVRQARELLAAMERPLSTLVSLAPRVDPGIDRTGALGERVFLLAETMRAAAARGDPRASGADLAELQRSLDELRARVDEIAGTREREGLAEAILRRDRAEEELRRELASSGWTAIELEKAALAKALDRAAVVAYRRYSRIELDEEGGRAIEAGEHLLAHVLRADGRLARVELGALAPIEAAVELWRHSLGVGAGRGIGAVAGEDAAADLERAGSALRALVLDPVLAAAGDAQTLHVCADDVLHLVPLDALPSGEGSVGDRWRIACEVSLARLAAARQPPESAPAPLAPERVPALLAMGGIAFRLQAAGSAQVPFGELPGTLSEVRAIAALFAECFGREARVLEGEEALAAAWRAAAPSARFLHLATHAYFAGEDVRSWQDAVPGRGPGEPVSRDLRGLAPMALCGLALAGAGDGLDALGRAQGIVTAEEIAGMDLSACELAVLSACDTNVGVRRAGLGIASLQSALSAAGVRTTLSSLWKVPDEATEDLMVDFYRRIWIEKQEKLPALWEAKRKLRDEKDEHDVPRYTTRDWAGWVLTGDPE